MSDKLSSEEKFIISQSPEITGRVNPVWIQKLTTAFPALSNRNYRLYFFGQLISMIGTWLQIVAQGWLILKFTTSPIIIGLIAALATVPTFLFTLFGGVIVDRFPKKKVLIFTNAASMILAFILGALTLLDVITITYIGIIAFLLGTVNAIDAPARQAFVSEMVHKQQLSSAIALNSGVFNAARAIGPGVAGILIATVGTGWAFIINSISYIAVLIALFMMHVQSFVPTKKIKPLAAIREGVSYSMHHPIIRTLLVFAAMVSVFGWSYTTLLPLIAKTEFHAGAKGLGYFYTAGGLGSLLAAIIVAVSAGRIPTIGLIIGGNCLFSISLILFTLTSNFHLAIVFLFLAGVGLVAQASTINLTIQNMVRNEFRGRVMSLYVLMFIGLIPLGNLQIGFVSEKLGTSFAIAMGAVILFCFGMVLSIYRHRIRRGYVEYKKVFEEE